MAQEQRVSVRRHINIRLVGGILLYLLGWLLLRQYLKTSTLLWIDPLLFILLFVGWIFFFSQFLLPVQGSANRLKIFWRLLLFWHPGPVIFVENGIPRMHPGEMQRKGPGVLWLDSASGGVIRNAVTFVHPIGPGVHFTRPGEYPAGFVDLHAQVHTIGPKANENPFQAEETEARQRRLVTSGLTRDGIEVVPNITVIFKIDAEAAHGNRPGSRFGYHPESVLRAIRGEGIEVQTRSEGPRRVRWNQLPALLAADLWREYLAKFTFDELFQEREWEFPDPRPAPPPRPDQTTTLYQPFHITAPRRGLSGSLAEMLYFVNRLLEKWLHNYLEPFRPLPIEDTVAISSSMPSAPVRRRETALQMIGRMVQWRLQFPEVPELDQHGRYTGRSQRSPEFELLYERGLRVRAVNINNLRFPESIEQGLIQSWTATWLARARSERQQIDQQRALRQVKGQENALIEYALRIGNHLKNQKPQNVNQTLRDLLHRSRRELQRDPLLQERAENEISQIDEILQWLESNP